MCGIVGWFPGPGTTVDPEVLAAMTRTLAHRGPDGDGVFVGDGVGFGHRRLAIVDLAGGAQPMRDAHHGVVVTFNGEIFNHGQLRDDLRQRGYRFATHSDTEVLLAGYHAWGHDLPGRLNGMFAFGVYDETKKRGMVVRDRMGQKPLYYAHLADGTLLFASEAKALLVHPGITRRLDPHALALYLTCEYVPWPHCIWRELRKLGPGQRLLWEGGTLRCETWYDLPFGQPAAPRPDHEWIDEVYHTLRDAVGRRLMSDVPLGVFLSGGLDSSAIVAMMAEHVDAASIKTFSIGFEEASFDESAWAAQVAGYFGTKHHVRTFGAQALLGLLPEVARRTDEPFADPSLLPTWLLSRFTREHVTVALGGDGGDELFLGYETFRADTVARAWRRAPAGLRRAVRQVVHQLPVQQQNFSLDFVLKRFVDGADAADEFRHLRWLSSFLPHHSDDPLAPALRQLVPDAAVLGVMATHYLACPDPDHRQRLSYAYLRTYLAEDILTKVDRASMANGLEARSPFMDPHLLSLAARMPARLKLRGGFVGKYALREAMRGRIPAGVLTRKKKGFGVPVAAWLNGPLAEEADRLLAPERLAQTGIYAPEVVTRLLAEHRAGRVDHRKPLWTLMMLELWREHHGATL